MFALLLSDAPQSEPASEERKIKFSFQTGDNVTFRVEVMKEEMDGLFLYYFFASKIMAELP